MNQIANAIDEAGGPARVAVMLSVTPQAVCFWRDRKRALPVKYGAAIESAAPVSGRRWLLWPTDWHRIWPELIGTEGAPSVPNESVEV